MKIIVLGAGLVGGPMAIDLAKEKEFNVSVADINEPALEELEKHHRISGIKTDFTDPENVKRIVGDFDFVLSAVPGFIGFQTLKAIIEAGKNVIDIAFFPENLFDLDGLAKENNVIAISDIGVAPGMSNILIGYVDHLFDKTEKVVTYVGGLPKTRKLPWEYKAVFSPSDVIEEYTRPARYIEGGQMIVKPALSDPELIDFPHIGTLEAFNSDGLRSLAETIDAPNMIEKTLRFKGHIEKIALLRDMGLFNKEKIDVKGVQVSPLDLTSRLLFPKWKLEKGEADITIMKVIIEGYKDGKRLKYEYDLYDEYDQKTGTHSMARTTGYTATVALRMVAEGLYTRKGITAPEFIGKQPECVEYMLKGLKERGVVYKETIEEF